MTTIDIYDKGQVDVLLAGKADAADVPVVTNGSVTLLVAGWTNNEQTINISGSTGICIIGPAPGSVDAYMEAGIRITAQNGEALTFTAKTAPSVDIVVNWVVI